MFTSLINTPTPLTNLPAASNVPPTPANRVPLPTPNWNSDTRSVVFEPCGVTRMSGPVVKANWALAYTKLPNLIVTSATSWRKAVW